VNPYFGRIEDSRKSLAKPVDFRRQGHEETMIDTQRIADM
jgi:hypothetical protein